jgi:hypothetical protein
MRKLKRLMLSIPIALGVASVGLSFSAAALLWSRAPQPNAPGLMIWISLGLLVALTFLVIQTYLEYRRRTYDPAWVLKLQDMWESKEEARATASRIIQEHKDILGKIEEHESLLSPIDDVLDMLEDIGFYMHGNQISPEVAHHHFYHWIRGYWCGAQDYIKAWQTKEAARWQHLAELYDETSEVEVSIQGGKKAQLWRNDHQISEFLRQEIGEPPQS